MCPVCTPRTPPGGRCPPGPPTRGGASGLHDWACGEGKGAWGRGEGGVGARRRGRGGEAKGAWGRGEGGVGARRRGRGGEAKGAWGRGEGGVGARRRGRGGEAKGRRPACRTAPLRLAPTPPSPPHTPSEGFQGLALGGVPQWYHGGQRPLVGSGAKPRPCFSFTRLFWPAGGLPSPSRGLNWSPRTCGPWCRPGQHGTPPGHRGRQRTWRRSATRKANTTAPPIAMMRR